MTPFGVLDTIRRIGRYARPYRLAAGLVLAGVTVETLFTAAIPLVFRILIDRALLGSEREILLPLLVALGLGAALASGVGLGRDYLLARVIARMLGDLRQRMFAHLQRLALDFYARGRTGDTLTCFSGDAATVENALVSAVPWAVLPAMEVALSSALLLYLDWRLALVAMLVFPVSLIGPRLVSPRATRASYERRLEDARAVGLVEENLAAQPVVKAFGLQGISEARFGEQNRRVIGSSIRMGFLGALLERSANAGTLVLQVLVLGCGALMVFREQLSVGSLVAFQALFATLSVSLSYVSQYVPNLVAASGALRHIHQLLDEEPSVSDAAEAEDLPPLASEIALDGVSFGYREGALSLRDVSLRVARGQSVALVGPSGSGKSTVINLLTRFYDPQAGRVRFDGHDLRTVTQASLRRQIGLVFQESFLFDVDLRENIRLGSPGASDSEVEAAAKLAEVHDTIAAMPDGYDTRAGERGSRLSGGQRQRVAIARALVGDPPILILDEATSALDPATEASINATLAAAARGRTVFTVTHRLAAAVGMDRLFVFDGGRLVEQGRHQELLERTGAYARLWKKQSGFELRPEIERAEVAAEKLEELPVLQLLSAGQRAEVARLFVTESLAGDRFVFREGDPGERFYLIVRGRVEVLETSGAGEQQRLRILEVGDYFGEIALLEKVPRSASVRTLQPSVFLSLAGEHFLDLVARFPELGRRIRETARARIS